MDGHDATTPPETDRRQRILAAAARVIAEQGVRAFTFRAVAQEAGVPLGSTTYYFTDRDDLLVEAVRWSRDASQRANEGLVRALIDQWGVADGLARFVEEFTTRRTAELTRNYRIYVTALYQPSLRPEVASWQAQHELTSYVDSETANMLARLVDGFLVHAVINQVSYTADETRPALERLLPGG